MPQCVHDRPDARLSGQSGQLKRYRILSCIPEFLKQPVETGRQGFTLLARFSRHFCEQQGSLDGIFVAHSRSGQIAKAFFKAEKKSLVSFFVIQLDSFADKLEAGQGFLGLHAIMGGDAGGESR